VYDVSFAVGTSVFGSAGADGSIRQFDLRSLEHSIILCENPSGLPFVRICWNRQNANYFVGLAMNTNKVTVFDRRYSGIPVLELTGHSDYVNSIAWADNSKYSLI
jgi:WD repeat-containing protein 68